VDLRLSPSEEEFRDELRAFLDEHPPPPGGPSFERELEWQKILHTGRWVAPHWPSEFGGRGSSLNEFALYITEMGRRRLPQLANRVAVNMVGPTLLAHGTEVQKEQHLEAILAGAKIWCQLLSEPDAGSDLGAVSTRAVLDGDSWVVNGQKVWSSVALHAHLGILLARTEPVPGPRGLTVLICDMTGRGVTVRPLRQITGDAEFAEVFLDDVRIPVGDTVGNVGEGWRVMNTTLVNERGLAFPLKEQTVLTARLEQVLDRVRAGSVSPTATDRQRLAQAYISAEIFRLLNLQTLTRLNAGEDVTFRASITKLFWARFSQSLEETASSLEGPNGIAGDPASWNTFLWYRQSSIAGGTSEIQRNILGERVLGLPRER
jgi:alkylation response protein AidB-like acyl-CoA dehydrogenase